MHRSRRGNIVIDCQTDDLLSEAEFWSAALGYPLPRDLDAASNFIQLVTPAGDVQIIIQRVRHEARAHLDLETDSIDLEVRVWRAWGQRFYPATTGGWSCKPQPGIDSALAAPIVVASIRAPTSGSNA